MNIDHVLTTSLEVTQGHTWERHITQLRPVRVIEHVLGHVVAECVILGSQDQVETEQLTNHVSDVEDLRDNEQYREIAAPPATQRLQCESKIIPLRDSDIFLQRLGIFSPNFTHLLYVPIYDSLQIFI